MGNFRITDNSQQILAMKEKAEELFLTEAGMHLESEAKFEIENNPRRVDTSRLRNSITFAVQPKALVIGTNVEYALYVHEGTKRMIPNRFLVNAVQKNKDQIRDKYKQAMQSK